MAEAALFAGHALRRLRKREGLTQAAMAARLAISPTYLNLLERNQRPLSARVLVQVIERFDFDPRSLREDDAIGGLDGMVRRLADKRFSDLGIDREEVQEFLAAAPQIAAAFARLYDKGGGERMVVEDAAALSSQAKVSSVPDGRSPASSTAIVSAGLPPPVEPRTPARRRRTSSSTAESG